MLRHVKEWESNWVPKIILDTPEEIPAFEENKQRHEDYKLKKTKKLNDDNNDLSCKI